MFHILRTYAYDAWKIFCGFLKPKCLPKTHTKWQNILKLGEASETWISKIRSKVTFPSIKIVLWITRSWFKVRYIPLIQEKVLRTQNVCVPRIKKFVRVSKVKVFVKNPHKVTEYSEAWQSFRGKRCVFLVKTLTLDAQIKCLMRRTHTFWVCKTFSKIIGTQRTFEWCLYHTLSWTSSSEPIFIPFREGGSRKFP